MKVGVKSDETWYNGAFFNGEPNDWKEGDEIELEIYTNEYQGKSYPNQIKMPSKTGELEGRVETLEQAMGAMKKLVLELKDKIEGNATNNTTNDSGVSERDSW